MQTLPLKARIYLLGAYLLGVVSLFVAYFVAPPVDLRVNLWEFGGFLCAAAMLGWKRLPLLPGRNGSQAGGISVGFIIIFAAMLRFGPLGAVVTGAVSALLTSIKGKYLWYQTLFNIAVSLIYGIVASMIFLGLNHWAVHLNLSASLPALVLSCLLFFIINSGSVATVISLCTGENVYRLWEDKFLWTAPGYFAGAAVSVLSMGLLGGEIPATVLCLTPVVFLTYRSFHIYSERTHALNESQKQLSELYAATTKSLALAIDAKDRYTHQHIIRVQRYAVAIAKHMGLTGDELQAIDIGALLHDIGKMGISEAVLLKPGRLTNEEYEEIKQHPRIGAEILAPVPFPYPVLPVVKYHHERWDGTGYPEGLKAENIPLSARILAVADVYDALTTDRSYRGAWSHAAARAEIERQSGKQFDPRVVEAFVEVIESLVAVSAPIPASLPLPDKVAPATVVTGPSRPATARNESKPLPTLGSDTVKPILVARSEALVTKTASSASR
jgi:putative nucleotidyltransferase with HDIG domain